MNTLPTLFLSHGSPMIALEPGAAGAFMSRLGPAIDTAFGRPRYILTLSAHTLARAPVILAASRHEAIHDFGNFDPRLNQLRYDAPGAPAMGARAQEVLSEAGIASTLIDEGGLDHGAWTALRYLYPDADIPILPIAFPPDWAPERLMALGAALAPLRAEGALILGSGSITHNLRRVFAGGLGARADQPEIPESLAFRSWFHARAAARDWPALRGWREQAPHARDMHPTDEHLLPWFIAAGAGGEAIAPLRIHESSSYGALGMDAYALGPEAPALSFELSRSQS